MPARARAESRRGSWLVVLYTKGGGSSSLARSRKSGASTHGRGPVWATRGAAAAGRSGRWRAAGGGGWGGGGLRNCGLRCGRDLQAARCRNRGPPASSKEGRSGSFRSSWCTLVERWYWYSTNGAQKQIINPTFQLAPVYSSASLKTHQSIPAHIRLPHSTPSIFPVFRAPSNPPCNLTPPAVIPGPSLRAPRPQSLHRKPLPLPEQ